MAERIDQIEGELTIAANLAMVHRLKPIGRRVPTMNKTEPIKVMIVDDHPIVRSGLATMLQAFDDLELVGEASSGMNCPGQMSGITPDVILMDMVMPEMDGLETTRAILEQYPSVKIIILTSFTERRHGSGCSGSRRDQLPAERCAH